LEELKRMVDQRRVDAVIFTNTLPSSQVFKIQRRLGDVKVIDRNLLILEVFNKRAMTEEAKLQIELARLRYTFSWGREFIKLRGILGEQVGWSGPGDYPFKEYEKAARRRLKNLNMKLCRVKKMKIKLRERRRELGFPTVALAGYVGLGPFTTLSSCSRLIDWRGFKCILVDSIGFIEDMHPMIIDAFYATLDEISNSDLVLLFVDVSESLRTLVRKISSINSISRRIEMPHHQILCLNKVDLVSDSHVVEAYEALRRFMPDVKICSLSSLTGRNVELVLDSVLEKLGAVKTPIAS
ncbi:MAG: hypothetical protein QXQ11_01490, partial [Candidatus Bathyarchaeia archaeon]